VLHRFDVFGGGKLNVLAHIDHGDAREIFYQQPTQNSKWYSPAA
jgi:hypothetical protein